MFTKYLGELYHINYKICGCFGFLAGEHFSKYLLVSGLRFAEKDLDSAELTFCIQTEITLFFCCYFIYK